ncbi:NAD-dependent epimerase/dehydratase family protein [Dactylosporangium sp. NPDC048998]|uniref:NAD-dependent epimerase/dehydratase family protein n=1 Tax=Dactylosporangium sp. NPDC048998 TaxID=3363976 RepID=UPI003724A82C
MKMLVLGGTVFLGRAVARQAIALGHDVVCAARGESGEPVEGARFVRVDRDDPGGLAAVAGEFDAVVDVARHPHHVRHAVAALAGRAGHYTFVSSGSAYADTATPHQVAATAPLLPPDYDADPRADAESYGRCKVACERLAVGGFGAGRTFVLRAGMIVGPEDPTGRFEYWVRRAARGGEVLAPGEPGEAVQLVDVRDLADWILAAAGAGLAGAFDGIGAPMTRREFHQGLAEGAGVPQTLTWVTQEFLLERGVAPWSGPRSLPFWLPLPQYAGFMDRDVTPSIAAGLRTRPLAETVRDTLAAIRDGSHIDGDNGLGIDEEAELLQEWLAG